jgi:hypothetical protein
VHRLHDRVRLVTDRFRDEGATEGMLGYIILLHSDGNYEVEISGPGGITVAEIVAGDTDLEAAPEA